MSYETDEFLSIARLGIDAESFMNSPLGRHLTAKAQAEIDDATNELIAADPEDIKLGREIRNKIHIASMFLVWMRESINAGQQAHLQLRQIEEMQGGT